MLAALVFLLAMTGIAHASSTGQLSDAINVDAFVPNAVQWLQDTFHIIRGTRIFPAMQKIGTVIVLAGFVLGVIRHWPARNMTAILRSLMMSVFAVAIINAAVGNVGAAGSLYRAPMDVWATVYARSTGATKDQLQDGVIADTKKLAVAMNDFVAAATLSTSVISENASINSVGGTLPTADLDATGTAQQATTLVQTVNQSAHNALTALTWIYQIGYLLLMGFFMAFAGVVYLSGLSVILGMMALPIAMAFWAHGHSAGVKLIVMTWVTAIVTVGLAPHIVVMTSRMALSQPTRYILSQIEPLNAQAKAEIAQYAGVAQACADQNGGDGFIQQVVGAPMTAFCQFGNTFISYASALGGAVLHIALGMLVMIMTLIVSLGVGAAIIRMLPNIIGGLLGANAGGSVPSMGVAGAARGVSAGAAPAMNAGRAAGRSVRTVMGGAAAGPAGAAAARKTA